MPVLVKDLQPVLNGLGYEVQEVAEDLAADHVVGAGDRRNPRRLSDDAVPTLGAQLDNTLRELARVSDPRERREVLLQVCGLSYLLLAIDEVERGADVVEAEMVEFHERKRSLE